MKIFINPGHCIDTDSGAVGYGLVEAEVAADIAQLVADYLQNAGYEVKIFQYDGLAEIVDVANYWAPDLFVSIHCNAHDGFAKGTESFYFSSTGKILATAIQNQIVCSLDTFDRGVKSANFFVLKYTKCPAVLIETAFIDNFDDNNLLANRQDDFARAIARGITDFLACRT